MTKDNINEYWHLLEAMKMGKTVMEVLDGQLCPLLETVTFHRPPHCYRIVEPPQPPKYRPWTQDECPLGAWFKWKDSSCKHFIIETNSLSLYAGKNERPTYEIALKHGLYSLDKGVTWLPCGVLI